MARLRPKKTPKKEAGIPLELLKSINLGPTEAERDLNLSNYFVENTVYEHIKDINNSLSIMIGEKGTGKSAILQQVRNINNSKSIINISNRDFGVVSSQRALSEFFTDENFSEKRYAFKLLWMFIVCSAIAKKIFENKNIFDQGFTRFTNPYFKEIDDFFGITKKGNSFDFFIKGSQKIIFDFKMVKTETSIEGGIDAKNLKTEKELDIVDKFNKSLKFMDEFVNKLDELDKQGSYFVLIDDLDEAWDNTAFSKLYIEGLIQSIHYLNKKSKFKVITTLLESVYKEINLRHIQDKINNDYVRYLRWNPSGCQKILNKRLEFFKINDFKEIFTSNIDFKDLYKTTTGTPRDILQVYKVCIDSCIEKGEKLNKDELRRLSLTFSQQKLSELKNYFKTIWTWDIEPIIIVFEGNKPIYSYNEINKILNDLCVSHAWDENKEKKFLHDYCDHNIDALMLILYQRGFIGYNRHQGSKDATYFNEDPEFKINHDFNYKIRDAYHQAMSIKS